MPSRWRCTPGGRTIRRSSWPSSPAASARTWTPSAGGRLPADRAGPAALQPGLEVGFDLGGPGPVDLAGRVPALAQPLVAELVAHPDVLRALDDLLRQVGRYEDHAGRRAEDDVAGQDRRLADPQR